MAKPISQATDIIGIIEGGEVNQDLSLEICRVLEQLQDMADPSGKRKVKGSVSVTLNFEVSGKSVEIVAAIASKTPKRARGTSFYFLTPDAKLSTDHPQQQSMEFGVREVRDAG